MADRGVIGGRIHVDRLIDEVPADQWHNEVLTTVNDSVVRLGVIEGEYHWHVHAEEDEFFMTLSGEVQVDWRDEHGEEYTVALAHHDAFTVPAGVPHRTRADERSAILMVERATVVPEGDRLEA